MRKSSSLAILVRPIAVGVVVMVGVVLALTFAFMRVEMSVTGLLNGESTWSKAQKQASMELDHYTRTGDPASLSLAQENLAVVTVIMAARNEIESGTYDREKVEKMFADAHIIPEVIPQGVFVLDHLRDVWFVKEAMTSWRQTDDLIGELATIANRLDEIQHGAKPASGELVAMQVRIYDINQTIDPMSKYFSLTIANGTTALSRMLFLVVVVIAAVAPVMWYFMARRILRRIRNTEERFQLLFDGAADAIVIVDEKSGVVLEANQAAIEWTGTEVIGRCFKDLFSDERFSPSQQGQTGALVVEGKPSIPVETQTSRITWADRQVLQYTIRDVSGRVAMERERRVAAVMGHEMRNPLNAIINASRLIDDPDEREETRKLLAFLSKAFALFLVESEQTTDDRSLLESCHSAIVTLVERSREDSARAGLRSLMVANAQLLLSRLNDAIDMASITDRTFITRNEPFAVKTLVRHIQNETEPQAETKDHTLVFTSEVPADTALCGDSHRIQQCVANITINAIKYSPEGSVVRIHVAASSATDDGLVRLTFTVTDSGIGIPDDRKTLIFEPYYQATKTDTHNYDGLGIGLYLVRTISESMQARIDVQDNPDGGTIISWAVSLPRADHFVAPVDNVSLIATIKKLSTSSKTLRCLVVDDTTSNRTILRHLLTQAGHVVVEATSGEAALERLRHDPFDVVMLDMHLPGMPGIEVIDQLQATVDPRRTVPKVIVISADTSYSQLPRKRPNVVLGYIAKPIVIERLLELLTRIEPAYRHAPRPRQSVLFHEASAQARETASPLTQFRETFDEASFEEFVQSCRDDLRSSSHAVELAVARESEQDLVEALHALKNIYFNIGYNDGVLWCSQLAAQYSSPSSLMSAIVDELHLHNTQALSALPA